MLQLLLAFISIGVVCCQNCPIYSTLINDPSLLQELNGTFYKVLNKGTTVVVACQKQTFTLGPNNVLSAYLQSSDWCLRLDNCDTSRTDYYQCDNTPLSGTLTTLPSTQRNSIKLAGRIGSGNNLCLLYSYCRISEEGYYVMCRNQLPFLPALLFSVSQLLGNLLNVVVPTEVWKEIQQSNCNLAKTCPP